ncbi:MAG: hypothetical protein Q8O31_06250 [Rhodocyclaceae bacterium]|nr:hypothetical protein [Rhodocyclaceae bacterium]
MSCNSYPIPTLTLPLKGRELCTTLPLKRRELCTTLPFKGRGLGPWRIALIYIVISTYG